MTDQQSPPVILNAEARLTGVETGLRHFHEISAMRNQQIWDAFSQLKDHNQRQDSAIEVMEEKLLGKIEKIYELLWSGMKWLGMLLGTTLSTIILKALGLI